jgi:hypothetical protein
MSSYYNPRRTRDLYGRHTGPFRLSRSKLDLFMECARCFYIDRRLGTERPPGFPFTLNSAVDKLLKKEFDIHRAKQSSHPLMKHYGVDAVPYQHKDLERWREARTAGITHLHEPTNFYVTGGVDDIWVNPKGELIVVDYKATAKNGEVSLDADWQIGYKRQVEIYQWLFRKNGFPVSRTAYFVYCNGDTDREAFDAKLEFNIKIIPYEARDDAWIEEALLAAKRCLDSAALPKANAECDYCNYRRAAREAVEELEVA